MDLDINQALAAHGEWKRKLRAAINTQEELDAARIARHDCCRLGEWLHGSAKIKYGHLAAYRECAGAHAIFHLEASKVAQLVNRRRYVEAEFALQRETPYQAASERLSAAIGCLWRDVQTENELRALGVLPAAVGDVEDCGRV